MARAGQTKKRQDFRNLESPTMGRGGKKKSKTDLAEEKVTRPRNNRPEKKEKNSF